MRRRVALVHDWLTGMRGGERCLEVFCELFPEADLYTLVHRRGSASATIERMAIHTSPLQRFPGAVRHYRYLLPLFPWAIRRFRLRGYDVVLSSSHAVAKGVRRQGVPWHICYCYTPMRYIWDQQPVYFPRQRLSAASWLLVQALCRALRAWDVRTARGVDAFIAISQHIAAKIRAYYNRRATVIPPPVDCRFFTPERCSPQAERPFYLMVSALVPYKRVDLAIAAFNRLRLPLVIVGSGPERRRLEALAESHIRLLGWQPDEVVREYYRRCQALIFPGEEDFGIVPLEAQACGRPVIALGKGGALESVVPLPESWPPAASDREPTGVFFREPTVEALCDAVRLFQRHAAAFDPQAIRRNALRFDRPVFKTRIRSFLAKTLDWPVE
jgi:glycosyltransferase involved in cell wall biosynthesis